MRKLPKYNHRITLDLRNVLAGKGEVCKEKSDSPFLFTGIDKEEILKEIINLDTSKASQDTDVPIKILKENADIFADFLHTK